MFTINNIDIFLLSYNRKEYILSMIKSLKKQTIELKEIVILDNGSSDGTQEAILSLNDKSIKLFSNEKNNGSLWNFQRAQNYANKEYVILLHDDDILHPKYFEYVLKTINEKPYINLICSGMKSTNKPSFFDFKDYSYNPRIFEKLSDFAALIYAGFPLNFSTAVYKTKNFKNSKIDFETYGKIADRPLVYDCAKDGNIALFKGQYIQYRVHTSQDSKDNSSGPFYNQTISLHKKYYNIIFSGNSSFISKIIFYINFYKYCYWEYNNFINKDFSFQEYISLLHKELKISYFELKVSKILFYLRVYYFYKIYRASRRYLGEYS
ncbi:glycosyltransferase family 2 protein [Arcobacter sp. F2176]|uniref:glycosyltransferase family 2 protein n=1 Tax=Arcobacter sp. F2176 TaxID=2044511 RepID=UPI00100B550E|nr:glycosyltransferase family 2 protein [Arcobacter sp. F2176]RXJ79198.1 hypothetical protein CRU95_14955 [Arcobacter sp. F2176]